MASLFDSMFAAFGVPTLRRYFNDATAVTLTASDGTTLGPFSASVGPIYTEELVGEDGRTERLIRTLNFAKEAGVPFWDGLPIGMVATIDGVAWAVQQIEALSPSVASVRVVRQVTAEFSRPGYRRN